VREHLSAVNIYSTSQARGRWRKKCEEKERILFIISVILLNNGDEAG
jgi:hypothetical protein